MTSSRRLNLSTVFLRLALIQHVLAAAVAAEVTAADVSGCEPRCCWLDLPKNYCGYTLPTQSPPMRIKSRLVIKNLQKVDETNLSYVIDVKLVLIWQDERFIDSNFTRADAKKCFPGTIRPDQVDDIWKPDVYIDGTMDGQGYNGHKVRPSSVIWLNKSTGVFSYLSEEHREITCDMNFENYPMDTQTCYFKIFTGSYLSNYLTFVESEFITSSEATAKIAQHVVEFAPLQNDTVLAPALGNKMFSVTGFEIRMVRRFGSFFSGIYLPTLMLVAISYIGFFIPVQMVPGRMALLVTIFLMLVNISSSGKLTGPNTQTMTALDNWMLMCKLIVAFELFEYAVLLHIKFANAVKDYRWMKKDKGKKGSINHLSPAVRRREAKAAARATNTGDDEEAAAVAAAADREDDVAATAKCRTIDWWAFVIFFFGTCVISLAYFASYM